MNPILVGADSAYLNEPQAGPDYPLISRSVNLPCSRELLSFDTDASC